MILINTYMLASFTLYDVFSVVVLGLFILAFAASMSKFKDSVQHKVEQYNKEFTPLIEKVWNEKWNEKVAPPAPLNAVADIQVKPTTAKKRGRKKKINPSA